MYPSTRFSVVENTKIERTLSCGALVSHFDPTTSGDQALCDILGASVSICSLQEARNGFSFFRSDIKMKHFIVRACCRHVIKTETWKSAQNKRCQRLTTRLYQTSNPETFYLK